jgi:two-component system, sensor histidine kinase PdtaS
MKTSLFVILLFGIFVIIIGAIFLCSFELLLRLGRNLMINSKALESEVSERHKAQSEAEISLKEKELLLKEIHHRVKNNMQIVASLLRLQARRLDDPRIIGILNDSRSRIGAMALIHESLYKPADLSSISLQDYIKELGRNLFDFYAIDPERIKLVTDVELITLNIETATPCGLIINELITNSLKYAFADDRTGEITIALKRSESGKGYLLLVADNGVGLPEGLDIRRTSSLGLQLVVNLTENQLQGKLEVQREHGTVFLIRFQEIGYIERL